MAKEFDLKKLLDQGAEYLDCDLKRFKEAPRISSSDLGLLDYYDILIFFAFNRYSMSCKSFTFLCLIFFVLIRSSMEGM